jgi:hypothetical protein
MSRTRTPAQWMVFASLGLMAFVMAWIVPQVSISGDELSQIRIGHHTYQYLGRTLGLLPGGTQDIPLSYYSGFFGVVTTWIASWLPGSDEILIRHSCCALAGFGTIVYAGKCARLLSGSWAQLLTIWLLFGSPRFLGAAMNNSKDIPFALGMTVSAYYLLSLVQSAPQVKARHLIGLFSGLFIALAIRIGGIFFGLYVGIAWGYLVWQYRHSHRAYLQKLTIGLAGVGISALLLSFIFLPAVWSNPALMAAKAVHTFSNYSIALTMLYRGADIPTTHPPWHYLPVWIGITIPLLVLLLFGGAVIRVIRKPQIATGLLLLMVVLPWVFVVLNQSAIYDSWRQYYFLYPPMVILAGSTGAQLYTAARHPLIKILYAGIGVVGVALPMRWSIRNHPLEQVYFNELIGGIQGAYGQFETDYYGDGLRLAGEKLLRYLRTHEGARPVIVAENTPTQLRYYLENGHPGIQVQHVLYEHRDSVDWDYGVFSTRGIDSFRKRSDWPPAHRIDSVTADGVLLTVLVKRPAVQDSLNRPRAGYTGRR